MSFGLSITRKIKPFVPNSTTSLKNSEEGSLWMENKDLKQRLEKRHGAKRLEAIALQDKNKSLMTALQLLNGKMANKHSNLHMDESLGYPVQQDSEWNQITGKKKQNNAIDTIFLLLNYYQVYQC